MEKQSPSQPPESATAAPVNLSMVATSSLTSIGGIAAIPQVERNVPILPLENACTNDSTCTRRSIKRKVDVYVEYEARAAARATEAKELKQQKKL